MQKKICPSYTQLCLDLLQYKNETEVAKKYGVSRPTLLKWKKKLKLNKRLYEKLNEKESK